MKLDEKFLDEISKFENIYCLISGGWHSTVAALLLYENGFTPILVHNSTGLTIKSSRKTMKELREFTGWEYIETKPSLPKGKTVMDVIADSLRKVPEVMNDIKNGHYDRTKFKCCYYLKKRPSKTLYKTINKETSVVISGITPYESSNRSIWLSELRNKNTFLRYHKKHGGVWHAYPFRDHYKGEVFKEYLNDGGWGDTKHSGCIVCPILIAFDIFDGENNDRYRKTAALAKKLIKMPFQSFIDEYS